MENTSFGITRSGQILEQTIKHDKQLARKCRGFYQESCVILNELNQSNVKETIKYSLRHAYLEQRQRQVDDDLSLTGYEDSYILNIKNRLKYVIRYHAFH